MFWLRLSFWVAAIADFLVAALVLTLLVIGYQKSKYLSSARI